MTEKRVCIHDDKPKVFQNEQFELCQDCTNDLLNRLLTALKY
jgi:hypothetical protein